MKKYGSWAAFILLVAFTLFLLGSGSPLLGAGDPPTIHTKQGGMERVFPTGTSVDFEDGATIKLAGTATVDDLVFTYTSGAANVSNVWIQAANADGDTIALVWMGPIWLSDAATGAGLTATTTSGTVQALTGNGTDFGTLTSKKALYSQSNVAGLYGLEVTDTSKTGFYPCTVNPFTGLVDCGDQMVSGDYGT